MAFIKKKDRQIIPSEGFEWKPFTPDELIKLAKIKGTLKPIQLTLQSWPVALAAFLLYMSQCQMMTCDSKIDKKTGVWA